MLAWKGYPKSGNSAPNSNHCQRTVQPTASTCQKADARTTGPCQRSYYKLEVRRPAVLIPIDPPPSIMRYPTHWQLALPILTCFPLLASARPLETNYPPACIIGAGPAGLTAASKLQDKGIHAIVFDKEAEIGGKCQSYYDEELVLHSSRMHDGGARDAADHPLEEYFIRLAQPSFPTKPIRRQ